MSCFFGCKFEGSTVLARAEISEHSVYPGHRFVATMRKCAKCGYAFLDQGQTPTTGPSPDRKEG